MAFADDLLSVIDDIRAIPGSLGMRPNRVYLVTTTWAGDFTGERSSTEDELELTVGDGQPPKVRIVNDEQRALGQLPAGTIEVGPLTPEHASGGVSANDLLSKDKNRGDEVHVKVVGPAGTTYYRIVDVRTDRAFRYTFRAEPVRSTE